MAIIESSIGREDAHASEGARGNRLRVVSVAELPSRFGMFRVVAFAPDQAGREHLALVRGDVRGRSRVPTRVHSECLTGDVLGSLRCDCRDQLLTALEALGREEHGVLLYLRQEGRGIGLGNKIRAYALQDQGHDTIDANHLLGFAADERDYRVAAEMLEALGVLSLLLMTNNPAKLDGLRRLGVDVAGRLPLVTPANPFNVGYLTTKQERAGHMLGLAQESSDPPAWLEGTGPVPPAPAEGTAGAGEPRN